MISSLEDKSKYDSLVKLMMSPLLKLIFGHLIIIFLVK